MTDGSLIHRLVCKKTSLSTFFEQFLVVLNLKYLHRIQCSENGRLATSPQHPIPAFCSDHTQTPSPSRSVAARVSSVDWPLTCSTRAQLRTRSDCSCTCMTAPSKTLLTKVATASFKTVPQ